MLYQKSFENEHSLLNNSTKWKKGLRNGKGTFTHSGVKIEEGIWKKNKLVAPK